MRGFVTTDTYLQNDLLNNRLYPGGARVTHPNCRTIDDYCAVRA